MSGGVQGHEKLPKWAKTLDPDVQVQIVGLLDHIQQAGRRSERLANTSRGQDEHLRVQQSRIVELEELLQSARATGQRERYWRGLAEGLATKVKTIRKIVG